MEKIFNIEPVFCEFIPEEPQHGKIYISKEHEVAVHLCACGCGGKAVTPLGEGEWTLTESQGKVSLHPSIGNWLGEDPYHAHYFVAENKIQWV